MKYKLTIIKYEKNDDYEAEMAKWKESQKEYGYRNRMEPSQEEPSLTKASRSLEVFLTEEEYKKVKGEVIKTFE